MKYSKGFIAGLLPGGWQIMLALLALAAFLFWRLQVAQEALGAHIQREAQLVADVEAQAATLAEERADRARVDALLAEKERERAMWALEWTESERRYQDAVRESQDAAWGPVALPRPAAVFVCTNPGSNPHGACAGVATVAPDPAHPGAAAEGRDERRTARPGG